MGILYDIDHADTEKVYVSRNNRVYGRSSSNGNQPKWLVGNKFIKLDLLGYESKSEIFTSHLLSFTNLYDTEYVDYYPCVVIEDGKELGEGCYSYGYKVKNGTLMSEFTIAHFLKKYGKSFGIGYEDLCDFMYDVIGYDIKPYLDKILCVDSIIRNDDRHFGNITFLFDGENYYPGRIYDNGGGCLTDLVSYPLSVPFDDNYRSVHAKPFNIRFEDQIHNVNMILLDYDRFVASVKVTDEQSIRAFKTILRGLKDMEGISWEKC